MQQHNTTALFQHNANEQIAGLYVAIYAYWSYNITHNPVVLTNDTSRR